MTRYKLIALDMDGTLLTDDKRITEETKKWLRYAVQQGVTVIFSTGRGLQTAGTYWKQLELNSPMVLLNGAEIWEGPGKLYRRTFLPRETVHRLYEHAISRGDWHWAYSKERLANERRWTPDMFELDWMKFGIGGHQPETLNALREELESWGQLEVTRSAPNNLEISVKGVTKASGVREVCGLLGIEMSDVMAVGDSDNDLRLLQDAGLGVAMANAEEHVKRAAQVITASNNEEGVSLAIRKHLFELMD